MKNENNVGIQVKEIRQRVDFSEYNEVHLKRADHLVSFMKCLNHAMEKTGHYEETMHQLKCIGYSDEFIREMCTVANDYKKYHKQRIEAEQTSGLPRYKYPTIASARVEQYAKNRQLVEQIMAHPRSNALIGDIQNAVEVEFEFKSKDFLQAYLDCDVDRMVNSITGWDLEAIFACAQIIPDKKDFFGLDAKPSDIAFPLYDVEALTEDQFIDYLQKEFAISAETWCMIHNAINFAKRTFKDDEARADYLRSMLEGVIPIPEEAIRIVRL